jgi:uncharacterized protein
MAWIRELRTGKHTMTEALNMADECERRIEELLMTSPLPDHPDYEAADEWLTDAYQQSWGQRGLLDR